MATIDKYKLKIEVEGKEEIVDLKDTLNDLSTGFAKIGSAGLAAFTALAVSGVKLADQMDDIGKAFGMTAGEVYNLSRAIEASGGNFNDTQQLLSGFSRSLGEVERGSSNTIKALGKLGLSRKELETLSDKELFAKAVQGLADMDDGFARTQLAMEIFGKAAAGIDFDEFAEGTKKAVDPELERRLKAAGDAYDKLAAAFRDLQMAALEAIGPIIDAINQLNFNSNNARETIKLLGAAIAAVFTASAISRGMALIITLMEKYGSVTKAAAAAQAFLTALTPKGLFLVAAAAGAATLAYSELSDVMDKATRQRTSGRPGGGRGSPDTGIATGTTVRTVGQTPEEKAVIAAKQQTEQLRNQIRLQNEYQQELINTIGLRDEEKKKLTDIAAIEKKYQEDTQNIIQKIIEEQKKGKDANQGVIEQYREQLRLLAQQLPISKDLKNTENEKTEAAKRYAEETKQQINNFNSLIDIIDQEGTLQKFRLAMLVANGVELKKINANYTFLSRTLQFINTQAKDLVDKIDNLAPNEAVDTQSKIYKILASNLDITKSTLSAQEKGQAIIANEEKILALFPEHRRKEIQGILDAIQLENQRFALQKKNTDELIDREEEIQNIFAAGMDKAFAQLAESVSPFKLAMDSVNSVISNVDNALSEFVRNGKFSFKDFANSVIADLGVLIARFLVFQTILAIVGAINPGAATTLRTIMGGARAAGGPVRPGKAYLVGERGPELFMPNSAGNIVPNNQLAMAGGGTTQVTYNINAVDASSFRSLVARDPQFIYNVTEVGRRSSPARRLA